MKSNIPQIPQILSNIPHIFACFTGKNYGSFRENREIRRNISNLGLKRTQVVTMSQIHGAQIKKVDFQQLGKKVRNTDGLITRSKNLFLMVRTADCIPLIAADRKGKVIGVAHIGWKGLINNILANFINTFEEMGISRDDIVCAIGPHICGKCYSISEERAHLFMTKFHNNSGLIEQKRGRFLLSLQKTLTMQCISLGIDLKNIGCTDICTYCLSTGFYSFRREGDMFGENAGVIGLYDKE